MGLRVAVPVRFLRTLTSVALKTENGTKGRVHSLAKASMSL